MLMTPVADPTTRQEHNYGRAREHSGARTRRNESLPAKARLLYNLKCKLDMGRSVFLRLGLF